MLSDIQYHFGKEYYSYHMDSYHRKPRLINTRPLAQQLYKCQRIFPARQSDKDFVPFFYQSILHHSFIESPFNTADRLLFFRKLCHIFKNRLQKVSEKNDLKKN